jgi:hypothetical protein
MVTKVLGREWRSSVLLRRADKSYLALTLHANDDEILPPGILDPTARKDHLVCAHAPHTERRRGGCHLGRRPTVVAAANSGSVFSRLRRAAFLAANSGSAWRGVALATCRATANSAVDVPAEFHHAAARVPRRRDPLGDVATIRSRDAAEIATLKGMINQLAQQVQQLALRGAEQNRTIDIMRAALAEATAGRVIPFRPANP